MSDLEGGKTSTVYNDIHVGVQTHGGA